MPRQDPRRTDSPSTLNEVLFDRAVRHAIFIERLKAQNVTSLLQFLNADVLPDMADRLEQRLKRIKDLGGRDPSPATTAKLRASIDEVARILESRMGTVFQETREDLVRLGIGEAEFQVTAIRQASPVQFSLSRPSAPVIAEIIENSTALGKSVAEWFDDLPRVITDRVSAQVNIGAAQGESVQQIMRRIRGTKAANFTDGVFHVARRHAQTIVRTSVNHVVTQARERTYKENSDIIKGVRYVATLDARTTDICMSLDGRVFEIGEGERPPMHHQCRSTTVPITKSWKELGIDLKEAPPGTRASLDGQVPANLTYSEWLKKQPKSIQEEALGVKRAALFRQGKIKIDKFVNPQGKSLTIDQLAKKEGIPTPPRTSTATTATAKKKEEKQPALSGQQFVQAHKRWLESLSEAESNAFLAWKRDNLESSFSNSQLSNLDRIVERLPDSKIMLLKAGTRTSTMKQTREALLSALTSGRANQLMKAEDPRSREALRDFYRRSSTISRAITEKTFFDSGLAKIIGDAASKAKQDLQSAIRRAPVTRTTVYRGMHSLPNDVFDRLTTIGKIYERRSEFESFTAERLVADEFSVSNYSGKDGAKILQYEIVNARVRSLQSAGTQAFDPEKEVFVEGRKFRVVSTRIDLRSDITGFSDEGIPVTVVQLEVLE